MPVRRPPGIFCLEGPWQRDLRDRISMRSLLGLLEDSLRVETRWFDVHTQGELEHLLQIWSQRRYERFPICYLGFHGKPGHIWVNRKAVSLQRIAELLEGKCQGRIIHFGSCGVVNVPRSEMVEFLKTTKARCALGYTEYVEWFASLAFEVVLLEALTYYKRSDAIERYLKKHYPDLVKKLGFRVYYKKSQ